MSSRVAGAALALIAAALLAVSIATPAVLPPGLSLFAGNPTVDGHLRKSQNMYVGLYNAQLCNNGDVAGEDRGGETVCKTGDSQGAFHFIGFAELGATGLGVIMLLGLGLLTLKRSEGRKGAARVVRIANAVGLVGAVGLVATHPVGASASIPIGLGLILHAGGLIGGLAASAIAVRPPAPIKLRSRPVAVPPPQQGIDMDALFAEDPRQAEPAQARGRRTEPPFGPNAGSWPGQHPGQHGQHPGQHGQHPGQHGQHPGHPGQRPSQPPGQFQQPAGQFQQPSNGGYPGQLRPLYEATPMHGGTGGLMPFERPVLPSRAPTPVPRAMFEVDIDVEPSLIAPMPTPSQPNAALAPSVPAPPPMQAMQAMQAMQEPPPAPERIKPKTLPPPMPGPRSKQMSAPPPTPASRPALPFLAPEAPAFVPPPADERAMARAPVEPSQVAAELPELPDPPVDSDGRPELSSSSPNTEPTVLPDDASAAPTATPPAEPAATAFKSDSASGSVPAIPAAPARPQRDTRAPAMRASVPMPARPGRPTMPTRPPPLRGGLPKATIAAPVVPPPMIPPIPGIPTVQSMPAFAIPPITAQQRAATELVPELAAARVPVEITDNASQTNVSAVPTDDRGTAHDQFAEAEALAGEPSDTAEAAAVRPSDTSPLGEPAAPPTIQAPFAIPPGAPTAVAFPVPIAIASPSPLSRAPKLPITTAPDSLPPPRDTRAQVSGPSPACPQCEAPMAWVEEHLRFYCKSCRMYF